MNKFTIVFSHLMEQSPSGESVVPEHNKFIAFYRNQVFIFMFSKLLSLKRNYSNLSPQTSFLAQLPFTPGYSKWFRQKNFAYHFSQCSCPANQAAFLLFDLIPPNNICRKVQIKIFILRLFPSTVTSTILGPNILPSVLSSQLLSLHFT